MTDKAGAESQADDATQSQADDTTTTQAEMQSTDQASAAAETKEQKEVRDLPKWAQDLIRTTRKEAADFRTKYQAYEDKDKTDLEKATTAATEAEKARDAALADLRSERAEKALRVALDNANALDAEFAVKALRSDLTFDDDGKPSNVDEVVAAAKKASPRLFQAADGKSDAGARDQGEPPGDMNKLLRRAAGYRTA